jgi:putative MFS transporter
MKRLVLFLGITLPREQHIMLLLVGSSLLINHYDLAIFGLALPQIQASLGIGEEQLGLYTGAMRLGVLLAFPLAFMADSVGRRRLLFITIVGMTLATFLSAFAQNQWQYLALQTLVRCFAYAEEALCFVIVAEEVAAERRGLAFGWLAALGAVGYGVAALLYGAVDSLPHGWRAFYVIGAIGLAVILVARRSLKETRRFQARQAMRATVHHGLGSRLTPMVALVRAYPGRFWAMAATTIPFSFGTAAALTLLSKYLQDDRHFSPDEVGLLYFLGGGVSVPGYLLAGPLSDRFGRRKLLAVTLAGAPSLLALVYLAPDARAIGPLWIASLFLFFAADVALSAQGCELFPTSYRATASAARTVLSIVAGIAGLAAESALYATFGGHANAIVCLAAVAPLGIVPLLFFLPETASRELEDIAPETEDASR